MMNQVVFDLVIPARLLERIKRQVALIEVETRQPTIIRDNTSITKAT